MSEERDIVERLKTLSVGSFEGALIRNQAASEIQRLRGEVERLRGVVSIIADGTVSMAPEGYYLAHRYAVKIARSALANLEREG